jgi:hypothetical protein
MSHKVIPFLMLAIVLLFIGCKQDNQPTQNESDLEMQELNKKPVISELITFSGDLQGEQEVTGCCPNAGPFPEYTMNLSQTFGELSGGYDGNIFMNVFGVGQNKSYMVQFGWTNNGSDYFIEIRGGVFQEDKKTKTLTATFMAAPCKIWINNTLSETVPVNFVLTREPAP